MSRRLSSQVGAFLVLLAGVVGWFAFSTALLGQLPASVPLAAGLLAALVLVAVSGRRIIAHLSRAVSVSAGLGGVLAFWAAPALAASQRLTDSPSGSVSLLLTTVAPGLAVVLVSSLGSRRRASQAWAFALVGSAGAVGMLANWERPSSFSPFVRFPERELVMLGAAAVFAVGVWLISKAREDAGTDVSGIAVATALVFAVLAAIPGMREAAALRSAMLPVLLLAAVSYAVFVVLWLSVSSSSSDPRAAAAMLLAPVGFAGFSALERVTAVQGPNPIVWSGAVAGAALCVIGSGSMALLGRPVVSPQRLSLRNPWALAGLLAALLGLASLFAPAIVQTARGVTTAGDAFSATWRVAGYQSAAGLAVAAGALCVMASTFSRARGQGLRVAYGTAIAALAAVVASLFLTSSTLSTWVGFVPTEIQQAYGTEYARLTVEATANAVRNLSMTATSALAIAVVASGIRAGLVSEDQEID